MVEKDLAAFKEHIMALMAEYYIVGMRGGFVGFIDNGHPAVDFAMVGQSYMSAIPDVEWLDMEMPELRESHGFTIQLRAIMKFFKVKVITGENHFQPYTMIVEDGNQLTFHNVKLEMMQNA